MKTDLHENASSILIANFCKKDGKHAVWNGKDWVCPTTGDSDCVTGFYSKLYVDVQKKQIKKLQKKVAVLKNENKKLRARS